MHKRKISAFVVAMSLLGASPLFADVDLPSKFTNQGTIANTRHNLTQRPQDTSLGNPGPAMDQYRNNYQQVCVYCHTPHGANQQNIAAPLWNRTVRTTTYTLYSQQTLSQDATQPGPSSLTCLSCHDGQTAVDSVVNMPGSGGYNTALAKDPTALQTSTLLNAWTNPSGTTDATAHMRLADGSCLSCHSSTAGETGTNATDFTAFALGTDLSNDHPVGVKLPAGSDWNVPTATFANVKFFDTDGDNRPDKNELRFYDSGEGYEVECASCHDPHGVPGTTSTFLPTFLRVPSDGSRICLTCHVK